MFLSTNIVLRMSMIAELSAVYDSILTMYYKSRGSVYIIFHRRMFMHHSIDPTSSTIKTSAYMFTVRTIYHGGKD